MMNAQVQTKSSRLDELLKKRAGPFVKWAGGKRSFNT